MLLENILAEFIDVDFNSLSQRFDTKLIENGELVSPLPITQSDFNILKDIKDKIWDSDLSFESKISIAFEFFEKFPSYYRGLVPFYHLIKEDKISPQLAKIIWDKFAFYLSSSSKYEEPVAYVLWVEFFEDINTTSLAWKKMLIACEQNGNEKELLLISGPAPWESKLPLYNKLIKNKSNHANIFRALLYCLTDVYGRYKRDELVNLLSLLEVDKISIDAKAELIMNVMERRDMLEMIHSTRSEKGKEKTSQCSQTVNSRHFN